MYRTNQVEKLPTKLPFPLKEQSWWCRLFHHYAYCFICKVEQFQTVEFSPGFYLTPIYSDQIYWKCAKCDAFWSEPNLNN